ncbi:MAG: RHS repeat protein, partial [Planctomycetes bacterium]|nr:RHS repeat protein [Planctomycetota bacterium]
GGGGGNGDEEECNVSFFNGEEYFTRTDLFVPGRGDLSFSFTRRYKSRITYNGPVGHNWDHEYHEALYAAVDGSAVTRVNGFGHVATWTRNPDGSYKAPTGYFDVLLRLPEGGWILRRPMGLKHYYYEDGRLRAREDKYGNRMLFDYDRLGNLDRIIDVYGREYRLAYYAAPDGFWRLRSVTDFIGRQVVYSYDQNGDLVEVRSPVSIGSSHGNDFPNGRVERYTYSSGFAEVELNHNMLTRTLPEEVATGGPPAFVWTYGTDPNLESFDRVIARTKGGTNASGISAGGTMTLTYQAVNSGAPAGSFNVARRIVTQTDRAGNVTEYAINEATFAIRKKELTRGLRPGEPAFYEEIREFDQDGQRTRVTYPEGNQRVFTYQSSGSRLGGMNLESVRLIAGPRGGGEDLVTTYTYEPLFNQALSITEARGNSTSYVAPIGTVTAARYTTRFLYDYQEHSDPVPDAVLFGIDLSSVPRGLGDLNSDGRTDQSFGHQIRQVLPSVELRPTSHIALQTGSTTQTILKETQYNDRGQILSHIDAKGCASDVSYYPENDPDGDGVSVFTLYTLLSIERTGYAERTLKDARLTARRDPTLPPPVQVEVIHFYDSVGNLTKILSPRGITTEIEYNAYNEPVVTILATDVTQAIMRGTLLPTARALAYRTRNHLDHNGRIVHSEIENRDGNTVGVGAYVDRFLTYDILNKVVTASNEVDATTSLTTQYRYDANQNRVLTTFPEGNQNKAEYDERDLVLRSTRGFGSPEASTIDLTYDRNGNLVTTLDAEDSDRDGFRETTTYTFDGFDRQVQVLDALGNRRTLDFDPNSNLVRTRQFGHPPGNPTGAEVLYSDVVSDFDELSRAYATRQALFVATGFLPQRPVTLLDSNSDGFLETFTEYDERNQTVAAVSDDGEIWLRKFDGLRRAIEHLDQAGNRTIRTYDKQSKLVAITEIEQNTVGLPPETFVTRFRYDELNRLSVTLDNANQASYLFYDSRDNVITTADPEGPLIVDPQFGTTNGPGNTAHRAYDGADRVVREVSDLRVGGTGAGALDRSNPFNPDGQIVLRYEYDRNSRLLSVRDDNGNQTSYGYDALNRKISQTNADSTQYLYVFDRDSNLRTVQDPNGSISTKSYDAIERMVQCSVTRAAGVLGTTLETFSYDGIGRIVQCTDNNGAQTDATIERVYNSVNWLVEERQNGRV